MSQTLLNYSHLGVGGAVICGCYEGGKERAYNEPPAACGGNEASRIGGSSSLFYPSGQGIWILDIGGQPASNEAIVQISQKTPIGTSITHNLKGSNAGAFTGEETNFGTIVDGTIIIGKYQYFKLTSSFSANTNRDSSPVVEFFNVLYPRGYPIAGTLDLILDVAFTPEQNGSWEIDSEIPAGASLTLTAKASNEGDFAGEETSIGTIINGGTISVRKRFYRVHCVFTSDADKVNTPRLKRIKANFPNG